MKSSDIFQLSFFPRLNIYVGASKSFKNLCCHILFDFKKGSFEIDISDHFPIAYDRISMKFLNLELFIKKAIIFIYIFFFNLYVFIVVKDSGFRS